MLMLFPSHTELRGHSGCSCSLLSAPCFPTYYSPWLTPCHHIDLLYIYRTPRVHFLFGVIDGFSFLFLLHSTNSLQLPPPKASSGPKLTYDIPLSAPGPIGMAHCPHRCRFYVTLLRSTFSNRFIVTVEILAMSFSKYVEHSWCTPGTQVCALQE